MIFWNLIEFGWEGFISQSPAGPLMEYFSIVRMDQNESGTIKMIARPIRGFVYLPRPYLIDPRQPRMVPFQGGARWRQKRGW